MCSKCDELDAKIKHLEGLAGRMLDPQTQRGIAELIAELHAQKEALHPKQGPGRPTRRLLSILADIHCGRGMQAFVIPNACTDL